MASRLSFREKLTLSLPAQAMSLSSVLIHNVYIKMYTDIIGLEPKYVSWIYFIFNIWNMLNDPVFGVMLDKMKYHPKRGKYVYVMRVTVPFICVMVGLMMFASPTWEQTTIFIFLLVTLFLYDTAGTFFNIAASSYGMLAAWILLS
ncbi:MAG: MFS transporter [Cellulosilyticaceae bacterium]